jgi:hypothetical protein
LSLRATCPLAFADLPAAQLWQAGALAQAGQGLARLLESYGEQAGGSVAIPLAKFQMSKSKLQMPISSRQCRDKLMQNDRATVNKKLNCKKQKIVVVTRIQNPVASRGIF